MQRIDFGWGCLPDPLEDEGIQREVNKILLLSNENSVEMLVNLKNALDKLNIDIPIKTTGAVLDNLNLLKFKYETQ